MVVFPNEPRPASLELGKHITLSKALSFQIDVRGVNVH